MEGVGGGTGKQHCITVCPVANTHEPPLPYASVQRESGASLVAKAADLRRRRGLRAELMQQFKKTAVQLGARRHTCGGSEGDRSKALAVLLMRVLDSRLLRLVRPHG